MWLDKARLPPGDNFAAHLKNAVADCSFFVSLISSTTEADARRERYFHTERDWIAQRQHDGYLHYLLIVIDAPLPEKWQPQHEPECFAKSHHLHLPNGEPSREVVSRMRSLIENFSSSGRPRG